MTENPYAEGTMSHDLFNKILKQPKIEPREKGVEKRRVLMRVRATFEGTSKPQKDSLRAQILRYIQSCEDSTATVEEIDAHFNADLTKFVSTRGYLQKLIEKGHLVAIPLEN